MSCPHNTGDKSKREMHGQNISFLRWGILQEWKNLTYDYLYGGSLFDKMMYACSKYLKLNRRLVFGKIL